MISLFLCFLIQTPLSKFLPFPHKCFCRLLCLLLRTRISSVCELPNDPCVITNFHKYHIMSWFQFTLHFECCLFSQLWYYWQRKDYLELKDFQVLIVLCFLYLNFIDDIIPKGNKTSYWNELLNYFCFTFIKGVPENC